MTGETCYRGTYPGNHVSDLLKYSRFSKTALIPGHQHSTLALWDLGCYPRYLYITLLLAWSLACDTRFMFMHQTV